MRSIASIAFLMLAVLLAALAAEAQQVNRVLVEVRTADKRFAGTDDTVLLSFGGIEFKLDDPNRDDFERGNADSFDLDLTGHGIDFALVRLLQEVTLRKPENSTFGGGWDLDGLTIRVEFAEGHLSDPVDPIFDRSGIGVELDGGRRSWTAGPGEAGWTLPPEPAPWPPCKTVIIEFAPDVAPVADLAGNLDSDCDGIPDSSDETFDTPVDSDGDGLPDLFEGQNGLDPAAPDTDGDGWWDSNNQRHVLVLRSIRCNGNVSGTDRVYLEIEDVRHPKSRSLDGEWRLRDDDVAVPGTIVDVRAMGGGISVPMGHFATRVTFREIGLGQIGVGQNDPFDAEAFPPVRWPQPEPIVVETADADCNYQLTFQSFVLGRFLDPLPLDETGDADRDGLREEMEFAISAQEASLRPPSEPSAEGYDGLADPQSPEVFMELDSVGEDARINPETKVVVASRYDFEGLRPRLDAGHLGGGGLAEPYEAEVTFQELDSVYKADTDNFWCQRRDHFHYVLFVDRTKGFLSDLFFGGNGRADRPGTDVIVSRNTGFMDFGTIVFIHELGHNFSLCHLEGGMEAPFLLPTCNPDGTVPGGPPNPVSQCRHYCGVPGNDTTAMGDSVGADSIIAGATGGALIGGLIGGGVGGPPGAIIGGVVGGLVGGVAGFFNSDAGQRGTDYHPLEWQMVREGSPSSQRTGLQLVGWPATRPVCP